MKPAAAVFDMYGTVLAIDGVRSGAAAAGARDPAAFVEAWRQKQLQYAFLASLAGAYRDFDTLTSLALEWVAARDGLDLGAAARDALAAAWQTLPAYDDVLPALRALRARNIPCAILTNGRQASAERVLAAAGVREAFDEVLSAEAVSAYKPDPRVYALAVARFGGAPDRIVFVSSNGWDAWGAATAGLRVAWCNRAGLPAERLAPPPEVTLAGLHELEAFVAG